MTSTQIWLMGSVSMYMIVMLAIGFWKSAKIKNTKDYIIAGGKLGWWLSIGTIFATWFGAETCMGSSRTAFEKGILGVIADPFGAGLCLILSGIFFVRYFHEQGYETVVDFFESRYGKKVAGGLGILYIPVYLGWIGGQFLAYGIILNALTGMPTIFCVIVASAVVLIYTYYGGMWADAATDVVQMAFILIGLFVLFPILLADLGGFSAAASRVPEHFFYFYPHSSSPLVWLNYLQAWMMVGIGSLPAQDLFQRVMSPKNAKIAKWSSILSGLLYIIVGLIPVFLGILSRIVLTESSGDSVLIDLSLKYLPLPLLALMVGALLSAIMSTADSALLAPAGIIGHNLIPYIYPKADETLKLRWCKRGIPLIGILSLILALYFQNVYSLCTQAWGFLLVGVAAPMIGGMFWKKATPKGAVAGALGGTLSWVLFLLFLPEDYPSNLFAFFVSCFTFVSISLVTQPFPAERISSRKNAAKRWVYD